MNGRDGWVIAGAFGIGLWVLAQQRKSTTVGNTGLPSSEIPAALNDPFIAGTTAEARILSQDSAANALVVGNQQIQLQSGLDLTAPVWNQPIAGSVDVVGNLQNAMQGATGSWRDLAAINPFSYAGGFRYNFPSTIDGITVHNMAELSAASAAWDHEHFNAIRIAAGRNPI